MIPLIPALHYAFNDTSNLSKILIIFLNFLTNFRDVPSDSDATYRHTVELNKLKSRKSFFIKSGDVDQWLV